MEAVKKIKHLKYVKLAAVFVALNVLDAILTKVILNGGGIELNPLMHYLFEQPKWVSWVFELGTTILVAFAYLLIATSYPHLIKGLFIVSIILMASVCLYNAVGLLI